jgi:hypothetical protein
MADVTSASTHVPIVAGLERLATSFPMSGAFDHVAVDSLH